MNHLLITGTDTDVGKTVLTTALIAYWQAHSSLAKLGVMKLLQTGIGDRELYQELYHLSQSSESIAPVTFAAPVAPPIAAEKEGREIDLGIIWRQLQELSKEREFVLIEALGGLGSPVTRELTVADVAGAWHLEAVLVVPVKLGAIAQAVANVALAHQANMQLKGIVLNCTQPIPQEKLEDWAPQDLIISLTGIPILGTIPYLADPKHLENLVSVASSLILESLLPLKVLL